MVYVPRSPEFVGSRARFVAQVIFISLIAGRAGIRAEAIYNSIPSALPGNVLSFGIQVGALNEIGDGLIFTTGTDRLLTTVKVVFASYACTAGKYFNPVGSGDSCVTSPSGATFSQPVTLNIYAVNPGNTPGAKLLTSTQTFQIPYRPSSDALHCGPTGIPGGDGTGWYSATDNACYQGIAAIASFDLSSFHLTLPNKVIIGVTFNTTNYGYSPIGQGQPCFSSDAGCPYDSLNVSTDGNPTLGSNIDPDGIYVNYVDPTQSCNGATSGSFRLDTPCWTGDHPQIEVDAVAISKSHIGSFTQGQLGATYTVMVTNPAGANPTSGTVTVTEMVPAGLTLVSLSGSGWTCNGNICSRSDALSPGSSYPAISVTVNVAANAPSSVINQVTVSGGGISAARVSDTTTINAPACGCDANGDGSINVADVQFVINQVLSGAASMCHSGQVNVSDVQRIINAVLGLGCH